MRVRKTSFFGTLIVVCALLAGVAGAQSTSNDKNKSSATAQQSSDRKVLSRGESDVARITREVHHELVMLPYYSVFDNLAYQVQPDRTVVLLGQVVRPTLKKDSEARIRDIEGVERIENKIEVLPTSINDDRLRRSLYRAIYGHTSLNKYAMGAVPPIHIIVKNGQVTLEGVVLNEMDKNIANIQANSVPGVFKVTNNLKVEKA